jgi:hypothetical protein
VGRARTLGRAILTAAGNSGVGRLTGSPRSAGDNVPLGGHSCSLRGGRSVRIHSWDSGDAWRAKCKRLPFGGGIVVEPTTVHAKEHSGETVGGAVNHEQVLVVTIISDTELLVWSGYGGQGC